MQLYLVLIAEAVYQMHEIEVPEMAIGGQLNLRKPA